MNAIFLSKSESINVYVCANGIADKKIDDPSLIVYDRIKIEANLYGGRIRIKSLSNYDSFGLTIDGIEILLLQSNDKNLYFSSSLSTGQITAYLNQIEQLGVDSFLNNYKDQIEALKIELNEQANHIKEDLAANEDEDKQNRLKNIESILCHSIIPILFSIMVNMNTGLDNHHYVEAYDNIINTGLID